MRNALLPGLGGPMGRHAKPSGPWFNPLPWTILVASLLFAVLAVRQVPCVQTDATNQIDAFIRLCYSDIPLVWTGQELGLGTSPLGGDSMVFSPVLGVLMLAAVGLSRMLGADIRPDADVQVQLDGAQLFFGINAVLLFVFFLVWVVCMALMGRESRGRYRSWDAMLVAAAPVVLASGLIHWELLPIGLSALGLYQFSKRRVMEAGVVLGLAAAAGTMPIVIILAVSVCIGLRRPGWTLLKFVGPAVLTWGIVHLPLIVANGGAVLAHYRDQVGGESSYGSLWFLLQLTRWNVRGAGNLGFLVVLVVLAGTIAWLYARHARPRVGTLVGIFVFVTCLLGASYPPQTGLWLLFALVIARPLRLEYTVFTVAQVVYWCAIWGYLSGHLTAAKSGNDRLYFLAIVGRLLVDLWLVALFYRDIIRPIRDPLRAPDFSDPIGGVLVDDEALQPLTTGG
ncbi:hypothetical protein [Tessaracoccus sp.]